MRKDLNSTFSFGIKYGIAKNEVLLPLENAAFSKNYIYLTHFYTEITHFVISVDFYPSNLVNEKHS